MAEDLKSIPFERRPICDGRGNVSQIHNLGTDRRGNAKFAWRNEGCYGCRACKPREEVKDGV